MPVPFLGRLHPTEYLALVGSFLLVGLEAIVRVFTLALPPFLVSLCYRASRRIFNRFSSPEQKRAENKRKSISTSVRDASDFVELCRLWGYEAEEHIVQTTDGYLLGIHRLQWRRGEEDQRVNHGPTSIRKRIAYLHHGLLMNSEVWVCLTDEKRCLPFELLERGFDVWFGNNRGNKYSKKAIHSSPTSVKFWDFSMDEFAFHDIPDTISYILDTTQQKSLSYIGFSQGTAQAFATLAIHPRLNSQVNVFIGLAPAMAPAGLSNGIVDSLVKASPSVLYLMFGRRSILSSATMWETLVYPPLFCRLIDMCLSFLFKWQTSNISTSQKLAAYPHLYSFTSTKSVVHWFQIIRNRCFQMYDDDVHQPMSVSTSQKYSKVAKYPTRNIRTPVVLVYGGSDSLVDIGSMLKELPPQTVATEIPHYEHLDFLWARDVDQQVFQHVFDALDSFTNAEHTAEEYDRYRLVRNESLIGSGYSFVNHRGSESETSTIAGSNDGQPSSPQVHQHRAREPHDSSSPGSKPPSRHALSETADSRVGKAAEKLKQAGSGRRAAAGKSATGTLTGAGDVDARGASAAGDAKAQNGDSAAAEDVAAGEDGEAEKKQQ
ncbi:alpha/beta hydrolase fold domain-containing protein [Hirsutella rhossiliensis]|uniref:Alpha/beta hydrolase fold domain-containing protein n=1 Tax=Hirsutella rhossiliensis TaxID=111463 RepID=A0A9P8MXN1_9HYPO|nr:alpha/beta hydrolase fold domain-containing protein [Hirsutella rhossiliensis]KAH0963973.1 alpha/beta hydrolase fold domain-containing protein [Hirsutella rhossiliensis]